MTDDYFWQTLTVQLRAAAKGNAKLNAAIDIVVHTDDPLSAVDFIADGQALLFDSVHAICSLIDEAYNAPDTASMYGKFAGLSADRGAAASAEGQEPAARVGIADLPEVAPGAASAGAERGAQRKREGITRLATTFNIGAAPMHPHLLVVSALPTAETSKYGL